MPAHITFIIGANGVGKSTVLRHVKSMLPETDFALHDFDERGVPDNADKTWRIRETNYWTSLGKINLEKQISTLVFGFLKPEEILATLTEHILNAQVILLDVDEKNLEKRIRNRYLTEESIQELARTTGKTVEKFVKDNVYVTSLLRKSCESISNCRIVDTSTKTPEETAKIIIEFIN